MPDEFRLPSSDSAPPYTSPSDGLTLPPAQGRPPADGVSLPPAPTDAVQPGAAPRPERPGTPAGVLVVESIAERIRRATEAGGLAGLPSDWGEEHGDWRTIQSENPFEVLYLDYRQASAIAPELVGRHRDLIYAFWEQRVRNMSGNATARANIENRYGRQSALEGHLRRIGEVYARLIADGGVAREAGQQHELRRAAGEARIADMVDIALEDGELTPNEAIRIIRRAEDALLTRDEGTRYVEQALARGGFQPSATPSGNSPAERLFSVRWLTAARVAEDAARAAEAAHLLAQAQIGSEVRALKFSKHLARSAAELVDVCDAVPDEAAEYLFGGFLEPWLSRTLNDAGLAKAARDTRLQWSQERAKGLELFVRTLSRRVGRPDAPVVRPDVANCAFGSLPVGARASLTVRLLCDARRLAWGIILCDARLKGLTVATSFGPDDMVIELKLDTVHVPPGRYVGVVTIQPEGGLPAMIAVDYTVVALTLHADRTTLNLGPIPFGQLRTCTVRVTTSPAGGRLTGSAALAAPQPGVLVEGTAAGAGCEVVVAIDTRAVSAGRSYRGVVRVDTNAGVLDLPLSFEVRLASTVVTAWSVGLAAVGGGGMWFIRRSLATTVWGPRDWYLSFEWTTPAASLATACIAVAALASALLALRRRVLATARSKAGASA